MLALPFLITSLILFALGTILGSFINVVIYRSISGESWVWGRSHCDHCNHLLAWFDNIPLFSFFGLHGKCRYCKVPLSISHPVVEFLMGTLLVWWYWGGFFFFRLTHQPLRYVQPIFWLIVGVLLLIIFVTDLLYYIIPDEAVAILFGLTLLYRLALTLMQVMQPLDFFRTILGTILVGGFFYFLWKITKGRGMGFGDVKFSIPFALLLGWPNAFLGTGLAFVIGAIVSIFLIVFGKKTMKQTVPFGPFLVVATAITLVWGNQLVQWYSRLL